MNHQSNYDISNFHCGFSLKSTGMSAYHGFYIRVKCSVSIVLWNALILDMTSFRLNISQDFEPFSKQHLDTTFPQMNRIVGIHNTLHAMHVPPKPLRHFSQLLNYQCRMLPSCFYQQCKYGDGLITQLMVTGSHPNGINSNELKFPKYYIYCGLASCVR